MKRSPLKPFNVAAAEIRAKQLAATCEVGKPRRCEELQKYNTLYGSKIVKLSARQHAFLMSKRSEFTPTQDMMLGNTMAEETLSQFEQEIGGVVPLLPKIEVAFNLDAAHIEKNILWCFEHKYLFRNEPDAWKIQSAAAQLLFYTALAGTKVGDKLVSGNYTGRNNKLDIPLGTKTAMALIVTLPGKVMQWTYEPSKEEKLKAINFYRDKASAIKTAVLDYNWDDVNYWDSQFKQKEHLQFFPKLDLKDFIQL